MRIPDRADIEPEQETAPSQARSGRPGPLYPMVLWGLPKGGAAYPMRATGNNHALCSWTAFSAFAASCGTITARRADAGSVAAEVVRWRFPDGHDWYGQVLQWRTRLWLIKPDEGSHDVFVHISALQLAGLKHLREGQRVTFDVEPDKKGKGPKAVKLVISF